MSNFIKATLLILLVIGLVKANPYNQTKSSTDTSIQKTTRNSGNKNLSNEDGKLSFTEHAKEVNFDGLIEIKEDEIPEGSLVYVLEEPFDQPPDGEVLKTANNIVFRPLFRYRGKQEAQRRSHRFKRRYFIPRRSYRHTYYPYYYHPSKYFY